jgi:hypothetical protein
MRRAHWEGHSPRWLIHALAYSGLGVVAAISVAIACSLLLNPFATSGFQGAFASSNDGEMWFAERWARPGAVVVISLRSLGPAGPPEGSTPSPPDLMPHWFKRRPLTEEGADNRLLAAYGWPLTALGYQCPVPDGDPGTAQCGCMKSGLAPWRDPKSPKVLDRTIPCRPLWRGLVFDALLWAGVLWFFFSGIPTLRRHRRRRSGKCPGCGYPLPRGKEWHEMSQET